MGLQVTHKKFTAEYRRESVILYSGNFAPDGRLFCDHGDTQVVECDKKWLKEMLDFFDVPENRKQIDE